MQAVLTSVSNPRWVDESHTAIDCEITTSQFGDEILPFTACSDDVEPHGRAIFEAIARGDYGPVAEYVPAPTPPSGDIPVTEVGDAPAA